MKQPVIRKPFKILAGKYRLELGEKTNIMGVINLTPDSFSHDGCLTDQRSTIRKALLTAKKFLRNGADIIDVGGESTRPGAKHISVKEEIARVIPVIKALVKEIDTPISIDTYKPEVVQAALDGGASIINNIMGVNPDNNLLKMVRNYHGAIILMHIQGTPRTMQKNIRYYNVVDDIIQSMQISINDCFDAGLKRNQVIIDPGIGFGKTVEHNLEIIKHLQQFNILKQPLLVGTSRKSFIGKVLNQEVDKRLVGTIATVCASIMNGVHIVRVHDVKEIKEAAQMMDAILNKEIL